MYTISKEAYEGDIVSRLRNWRGLHLAHGGRLYEEAADEIERLRLTAQEREAIMAAMASCRSPHFGVLGELLERMR